MRPSFDDPIYLGALVVLTLGLLAVLASVLIKGWSATFQAGFPERAPAWWSFSQTAWKGWRRATPTLLVGGVFLVGGSWLAGLADKQIVPSWIPLVLGLTTLLIGILANLVIFFSFPERLVPPDLRGGEQGVAVAWWRERRKRRKTSRAA